MSVTFSQLRAVRLEELPPCTSWLVSLLRRWEVHHCGEVYPESLSSFSPLGIRRVESWPSLWALLLSHSSSAFTPSGVFGDPSASGDAAGSSSELGRGAVEGAYFNGPWGC